MVRKVRSGGGGKSGSGNLPKAGDAEPDEFETAVAEASAAIRAVTTASLLQLSADVGKIVLDRFYGGDPERFRSHGRKDVSIRKLAKRLEAGAGMNATAICRSVQTHLLLLRVGQGRVWTSITSSHLRAALKLPDAEQESVLLEAESAGWSFRDTVEEVRRRRSAVPGAARVPVPRYSRTTRLLERISGGEGRWLEGLEEAAAHDPAVAEQTRQRLASTIERLERLLHRLSPRRLERKLRVVDGSG